MSSPKGNQEKRNGEKESESLSSEQDSLEKEDGLLTNKSEEQRNEKKKIEERESIDEDNIVETCLCGHNRHHHLVTPSATYTAWGTFWITIMGVSAVPIRIDFICRVCNEKFDFEIDPDRLKDFY